MKPIQFQTPLSQLSHMPQQFSPLDRKNHSSMTIKIFMSNVSAKVKSKIKKRTEEKTSCALSQNETKVGEAKKEKPFPGEGFLSLFYCFIVY